MSFSIIFFKLQLKILNYPSLKIFANVAPSISHLAKQLCIMYSDITDFFTKIYVLVNVWRDARKVSLVSNFNQILQKNIFTWKFTFCFGMKRYLIFFWVRVVLEMKKINVLSDNFFRNVIYGMWRFISLKKYIHVSLNTELFVETLYIVYIMAKYKQYMCLQHSMRWLTYLEYKYFFSPSKVQE